MADFKTSLFIFRRDLRIEDNTGLIEACKRSEKVIPCFIFDPRQVKNNPYKSDNAVQFMVQSLKELNADLKKKGSKLHLFYGKHEDILKKLEFDAVFINRDYTPFARKRDKALRKIVGENFFSAADCLLNEPEDVTKKNGEPYSVFTPFMKKAKKNRVRKPQKNKFRNFGKVKDEGEKLYSKVLGKENKNIFRNGGRKEALSILKSIAKYKNYADVRNYPAIDGTTGLSAHNKFGTISIREFYWDVHEKIGFHSILLNELYWRDFFHHVAYNYPRVFGHAFRKKYDKLKWGRNANKFKAWCDGKTGFPIVDAGMRQLNATGFMHNRVRMIVSSFLTKDLYIDWRMGEKYFAQKLIDYDPSVNNGNWQWAASTGCDAQPYFRIFNPWLQQKKFDPKCEYIKEWVPELRDLKPFEIHNLSEKKPENLKYPDPIVVHQKAKEKTLKAFKSL